MEQAKGDKSALSVDSLLAKNKVLEAQLQAQAKDHSYQMLKLEDEIQSLQVKVHASNASLKHLAEVEDKDAELQARVKDLQQEIDTARENPTTAPLNNKPAAQSNSHKQLEHIKKELEALEKDKVDLEHENDILIESVKTANETIRLLRYKITVIITDIDLSLTDWTICLDGESTHNLMRFCPFEITMQLFHGMSMIGGRSELDGYDDYRKEMIEHHHYDHTRIAQGFGTDADGQPKCKIPTGDEIRDFFVQMDAPRKGVLEFDREIQGIDRGTIGNY